MRRLWELIGLAILLLAGSVVVLAQADDPATAVPVTEPTAGDATPVPSATAPPAPATPAVVSTTVPVTRSLRLVQIDTSAYPAVTAQIWGRHPTGEAIDDFAALTVLENGVPVDVFTLESLPVGRDVTFVIDANVDINWVDLVGDVPRIAKVRTSIASFANRHMNRAGLDRVSIVVPDGDAARLLIADGADPATVVDAIGAYTPEATPENLPAVAPVEALLQAAVGREAADDVPRFRAVVFYTDGATWGDSVDYEPLLATAAAQDLTFYVVIIGRRADPAEVAAAARLYAPTGGDYLHMFEAAESEQLFDRLDGFASQTLVRFRSSISATGAHTLAFDLGGVSAATTFDLTLSPPEVAVAAALEPLQRGAAMPETAVVEMQLAWPDGLPRQLADVRLLVDGELVSAPGDAILDASGRLTVEWAVGDLAPGDYTLVVEVQDELGLVGRTAPFTQTVVAEPVAAPTATSTPLPTPTPSPTPSPFEVVQSAVAPLIGRREVQIAASAAVALLLLTVVLLRRNRRNGGGAVAGVRTTAPFEPPPYTPPARFPEGASLIVLENAPDHAPTIPLEERALTIGSNPAAVELVFRHSSVAPYHARLRFNHGVFLLYDEGSMSGTLVNRERLGLAPQILRDGDEIWFGQVKLRLRLADGTAAKD